MRQHIVMLIGMLCVFSLFISCEKDNEIFSPVSDYVETSDYAAQVDELLSQLPADELDLLTTEDIAEFKLGPDPNGIMPTPRSDFKRTWHPVLAIFYCKSEEGVVAGTGPWYGRRNADILIEQDIDMQSGFVDGTAIMTDVSSDELTMNFTAGEAFPLPNNRMRQNLSATMESGTGMFFEPEGTLHLGAYLRANRTYPVVILARGWVYFGEGMFTTPRLQTPPLGAVLDNGCSDQSDAIVWEFDWEDFPGATEYHIYVEHQGGTSPVVNTMTTISEFTHICDPCYVIDDNATNWFWKVRARVEGVWTGWSENRRFSVEPLDTDCAKFCPKPQLISPAHGAVLDNGCQDQTDEIVWQFDWESCPDASKYHLYVRGPGSTIPLIDLELTDSEFTHHCNPCYIINSNTTGWTWQVRTMVSGVWTEWSDTGRFNVEALNTDCLEMARIN